MPFFSDDVLTLPAVLLSALILGLIVRRTTQRRLERRAWSGRGPAPSRPDRREIRLAVRQGRAVGDRTLAAPAVAYGEQVQASIARTPSLFTDPPHGVYIFGRIFFPVLGIAALAIGITAQDPVSVTSGSVLLAMTALYLPVTERWARTRTAQRNRRLQDSVAANRLLSTGP